MSVDMQRVRQLLIGWAVAIITALSAPVHAFADDLAECGVPDAEYTAVMSRVPELWARMSEYVAGVADGSIVTHAEGVEFDMGMQGRYTMSARDMANMYLMGFQPEFAPSTAGYRDMSRSDSVIALLSQQFGLLSMGWDFEDLGFGPILKTLSECQRIDQEQRENLTVFLVGIDYYKAEARLEKAGVGNVSGVAMIEALGGYDRALETILQQYGTSYPGWRRGPDLQARIDQVCNANTMQTLTAIFGDAPISRDQRLQMLGQNMSAETIAEFRNNLLAATTSDVGSARARFMRRLATVSDDDALSGYIATITDPCLATKRGILGELLNLSPTGELSGGDADSIFSLANALEARPSGEIVNRDLASAVTREVQLGRSVSADAVVRLARAAETFGDPDLSLAVLVLARSGDNRSDLANTNNDNSHARWEAFRQFQRDFAAADGNEAAENQAEEAYTEALGSTPMGAAQQNAMFDPIVSNVALSQLLNRRPDLLERLTPSLVDLDTLQRDVIQPNEVVISLVEANGLINTVAITQDGVYAASTGLSREDLTGLLERIRASITNFLAERGDGAYPVEDAHRAYQAIVEPVAASLSGIEHITIVADGLTQAVPFAALVSDPNDAGGSPRYLIDDYTLSLTPGLASLTELRRHGRDQPKRLETLAMVSNPRFQSSRLSDQTSSGASSGVSERLQAMSAALGQINTVCELDNVSATDVIADQLAKILRVLDGADLRDGTATEQNFRALASRGTLADADVIAFNTHGLVSGQTPTTIDEEPALALLPSGGQCRPDVAPIDDGFITASEAFELNMPAELVLLTACNTAAPRNSNDAPLTGLARGFLAAGAKSIVVSNWDAKIAAEGSLIEGPSEIYMERLLSSYRTGSLPQAARDATIAVRAQYAHPAYWAVFSVITADL